MKYLSLLVVLAVLIGGGYWYMQLDQSAGIDMEADQNAMQQEDMGSYSYVCDNGSEFTMTPSSDMASVELTAGSQGMFTGVVTVHKMGEGNHFENETIVFSGAGEEVRLEVGNESTVCNPKPNPDMAPWNWGDAGEGGGVKQDVTVIVSESIVGKWESVDDATFVREFQAGGKVVDWSGGKTVSSGTYVVFTKEKPVTVAFPIAADSTYIQLTMQGTQAEHLNFKFNKLTPEELELTYMDRGGVLRFKAVQ